MTLPKTDEFGKPLGWFKARGIEDLQTLRKSFDSDSEFWKHIFKYQDGFLYWKVKPAAAIKVGDRAGFAKGDGYYQVRILNVWRYVHRIIFEMHHGATPLRVDHKDTNPSNNLIDNLRSATNAQNIVNSGLSSSNTTGHKGVVKRPSGRWRAQMRVNRKMHELGSFDTYEEACKAHDNAYLAHYGDFAK